MFSLLYFTQPATIRKRAIKENQMTRSIIKTSSGFVVYGAFTCMMRLDTNGNVVYSNMKPDSKEYKAMFRTFKKSI
jgi:hypothetical protein